jgi:hypothetical protein
VTHRTFCSGHPKEDELSSCMIRPISLTTAKALTTSIL